MKGSLITFEGISGMGKTEYFNRLKNLYKDNLDVTFNGEITDGNHIGYADKIFEILLSTGSRFFDLNNPKAETLLIAAKQAFDEENYIIPELNKGNVVISDRGYDTICIVEGIMMAKKYGETPMKYCNQIYNFLYEFNILPDKTILLDGNVEKSIKRAESRDNKKYTVEERRILYECAELYKYYSQIYTNRFEVINRDKIDEEVLDNINNVVKLELKRKKEFNNENYTCNW